MGDMEVVDGVRYRPEDAPTKAKKAARRGSDVAHKARRPAAKAKPTPPTQPGDTPT